MKCESKTRELSFIHDNKIFCINCAQTDYFSSYLKTIGSIRYKYGECSKCSYLTVPVDEDLVEILQKFNKKGYYTSDCCIGHFEEGSGYKGLYLSFEKHYLEILNQDFTYFIVTTYKEHLILYLKKEYEIAKLQTVKNALNELVEFSNTLTGVQKETLIKKETKKPIFQENPVVNFYFNSFLTNEYLKKDLGQYQIIEADRMIQPSELASIKKPNIIIQNINSLKDIILHLPINSFSHPINIIVPMNEEKEKHGIPTFSGYGSFRDIETFGLYHLITLLYPNKTNTYICYKNIKYLVL